MPYVRSRTWIQPAPRIRGLSRRRGMGQGAQCPSMEQLQGIVDSSDPCQNPVAALPVGAPAGSILAALPVSANPIFLPASTTPTLTQWFQQNQSTVLLLGGGLFILALVKGMSR